MIKPKITVELTLKDGSKLTLDKSKIKNIESLSQSNADASTIFYGVLASSGRLEILDYDGTIKRYIQEGIIDTSSIKVDIYTNGVLTQTHISSDSNYANESSVMSISLTNKLTLWDTLNFAGYSYPEEPQSAYTMLYNILKSSGYTDLEIESMLSNLTATKGQNQIRIKDYLKNIQIKYPYLPADTLRATIDKFCTLAQLNVILDNEGNIKFVNARPIINDTSNVIQIPLNKQYGAFTYSVILKNQYDAIEMNEYNVKQITDFETLIGAFNSSVDEFQTQSVSDSDENSTTIGDQSTSRAYMNILYYYGELTLNRRQNHNLKYISKIYTGVNEDNEPYTKHNINYTHKTGICDAFLTPIYDKSVEGNGTFATYDKISYTYHNASITKTDLTNLNDLPVNSTDNEFKISFKVVAGKTTRGDYSQYSPPVEIGGSGTTFYVSEADDYIPKEVEISFYGDVREVEFTETSVSSGNINNASNPYSLTANELFQQVTTINGEKISEVVKNNILSDYADGIPNGKLTIATTNYLDSKGNKIVDISKGQTVKVGDIVQIEGDNRYWRVAGANQRKTGTPYIDLEVSEVKYQPAYIYSLSIDMSLNSGLNGYILIPIETSSDFYIDWGDGNTEYFEGNTNSISHTYSDANFAGKIKFGKNCKSILFNNDTTYDAYKMVVVKFETFLGTDAINEYALYGTNAKSMVLNGENIKIGKDALFSNYLTDLYYNIKNADISTSGIFGNSGQLSDGINVVFGEDISSIPSYLFYSSNLGSTPELNILNISIPSNIVSIGNSAFENCTSLKQLIIPHNVKVIGKWAFANTSISNLTIEEGVEIITSAFAGCSVLEEISIPSSIIKWGGSFSYCTFLKRATIHNGVTKIDSGAFYGCDRLIDIEIPSSVTSIEGDAFNGCSSLASITIPDSVTSIGGGAFESCSSLTSIIIPSSVTSIGGIAFASCSNLATMTINAITPPLLSNRNAIPSTISNIFIPTGTLASYQNATNWSYFSDKFTEI